MNRYLPFLFLALAVFAVYSNVYDNVIVFDDDLIIRLNEYIRSWNTFDKLFTASTTEGAHIAGGFYRPMQNLLYFFVYQFGGLDVFGYHLVNVALQAANACLGYRLALRLGFDPRAALFAMLIWALHPIHTEAITYMSGTADPLYVFFCLIGLNIVFPQATMPRILWSLPFFMLALLSKETAAVYPALVCVTLYLASDERNKLKTYLKTWPLWLVGGIYMAWRVTDTHFDGPARYEFLFSMPEYGLLKMYATNPELRIYTFLATLPSYAGLLLWPVGLHMERSFPVYPDMFYPIVVGGIVMLGAALFFIFRNRDARLRPLSWGLLWFGAAHAPDTGLLVASNSLFLEHWMYLPTLGLFLGIAEACHPFVQKLQKPALRYGATGLAFIIVAALSARTFDQNKNWRDQITFYNYIFSYGVVSPRAHNNLAIAYANIGDYQKAIDEYRRAVQEGDTYAETHFNLALSLLGMPDQSQHVDEAIAELERSLAMDPRFYRSYGALAQIYAQKGNREKAEYYMQKARESYTP